MFDAESLVKRRAAIAAAACSIVLFLFCSKPEFATACLAGRTCSETEVEVLGCEEDYQSTTEFQEYRRFEASGRDRSHRYDPSRGECGPYWLLTDSMKAMFAKGARVLLVRSRVLRGKAAKCVCEEPCSSREAPEIGRELTLSYAVPHEQSCADVMKYKKIRARLETLYSDDAHENTNWVVSITTR